MGTIRLETTFEEAEGEKKAEKSRKFLLKILVIQNVSQEKHLIVLFYTANSL